MLEDNDFLDQYEMWMEAKRLEKIRQAEKRKKRKRENKLSKIALTIEEKIEKRNAKRRLKKSVVLKNRRKRKKLTKLKKKLLKKQGWCEGYTRQDISIRNRKPRDLELCKEVYDRFKAGFTIRELSNIYNRPYVWVFRYKKEHEEYMKYLSSKEQNETNTNKPSN